MNSTLTRTPHTLRRRGVFNTLLSPGNLGRQSTSLRITSWNCRALFCRNDKRKRRKLEKISSLAASADIILLQETHGDEFVLDLFLSGLKKDFWIFSSFIDHATGGIITAVRKKHTPDYDTMRFEVYSCGRISRLEVAGLNSTLVVWNTHNYEIERDIMKNTCAALIDNSAEARRNPCRYMLVVMGDFNFNRDDYKGKCYFKPTTTTNQLIQHAYRPPRSGQVPLEDALKNLAEISQNHPTHFNVRDGTGTGINRVFVSTPSWALPHMRWQLRVDGCPMLMHRSGLSDHVPMTLICSDRKALPKAAQPISKEVFKHPKFLETVTELVNKAGLNDMVAVKRWETHKKLIREAARRVRNYMLVVDEESAFSKAQVFSSIARAVWNNDVKLAKVLANFSQIARDHLDFSSGNVALSRTIDFDSEAREIFSAEIENRSRDIQNQSSTNKQALLSKLARQWRPFGRTLVLTGVITNEGVVRDPCGKASALGSSWARTFAEKEFLDSKVRGFLDKYARPYELSTVTFPSVEAIIAFLVRAKDSAPGPDGLPYSAWLFAGEEAAITLYKIIVHMHNGFTMPLAFYQSLGVFPPKGENEDDENEVNRQPENTRPLNLKNTDNKTITGAVMDGYRRAMKSSTHKSQRGFVPDRHLIENVIDLDSASRIFAFQNSSHPKLSKLPAILAFWDFAAAFPSVFHKFIFAVLEARGFPLGFIDFIKSLYFFNAAYYSDGGSFIFLFWIFSGVLQGCNASAFLFDCVLDPFLEAFSEFITQNPNANSSPAHRGIIRACADDIGAALLSLKGLKYMEPIFDLAEQLAGLTLKPSKCVLIPISARFDETIVYSMKVWLSINIPKWSDFQIRPAAKYLGICMGPQARALQWAAPLKKFCERAQLIGSVHAPLSISSLLYNSHAVSLLPYVAQVCSIPDKLKRLERLAIHKVWHFATNAMTSASYLNLHITGVPKLRSVMCSTRAAQFRAAWKFKSIWQEWLQQLKTTAESYASLSVLAQEKLTPTFWDTVPVSVVLSEAWEGGRTGSPGRRVASAIKLDITSIIAQRPILNRTGFTRPHPKPAIQSLAHEQYMKHLYPSDIENVLERRLQKILGSGFVPGSLQPALDALRGLRPFQVMQVIKTWSNSWATTHRFHEARRLPCLFGCADASDDLAHYAFCEVLRSIMIQFAQPSDSSGTDCLGLTYPSVSNLKCIACMFYAYHAVKHLDTVKNKISADRTSDFTTHEYNLHQRLFAGSFEAALRHA
jgi:endonuclease/exonuclease/phosphatase family metal-dependent hydrolase